MPFDSESTGEPLSILKRPSILNAHPLRERRYSSETNVYPSSFLATPTNIANLKERSKGSNSYGNLDNSAVNSSSNSLRLAGHSSLQCLFKAPTHFQDKHYLDEFSHRKKSECLGGIYQSFDFTEQKQFFKSIKFSKQHSSSSSLLFSTRQINSIQQSPKASQKPRLRLKEQLPLPSLSQSTTLQVSEELPQLVLPRTQKQVLLTARSHLLKSTTHDRIDKLMKHDGSKRISQIVESLITNRKNTLNSILKLPLIKTNNSDGAITTPSNKLLSSQDKSPIDNSNINAKQNIVSNTKKKRVHFTFCEKDTDASNDQFEAESD